MSPMQPHARPQRRLLTFALLSAIAAWARGSVAPCAIVLTSSAAREFQQLLDLCKVNTIESLRIVSTADAALAHVRAHLERRTPGA